MPTAMIEISPLSPFHKLHKKVDSIVTFYPFQSGAYLIVKDFIAPHTEC